MKLTRRLFRATALLALALLPSPASAQLSPDWFGTWHLDVARSTFNGPAPYVRGTWKVQRGQADDIVMIYDQVGKRGGVTHMEWKGAFDGTDHRLQGPDAIVTYAYTRIDDRTLNLVVKVDGRPTATARVVLSPEGTVTATTENRSAGGPVTTVTVYAKR
jgi:hypothetical protein